MQLTPQRFLYRWQTSIAGILLCLGLAACTGVGAEYSAPTIDPTTAFQNALLTATYSVPTQVVTTTPAPPTPTVPTPTASPDPNRTPPALPTTYQSSLLNQMDTPHTYIEDTCSYLKMKWDPNNSAPGTVVMPIMFHGITDGEVTKDYQISQADLDELVRDLVDQGFEAITIQQLRDFLYLNAKIPQRSVILIVDDRHYGDYYNSHLRPLYEKYGWTVVNGWISDPGTLMADVLSQNQELENEGWVDHEGHGVVHNTPIEKDTPEEYIRSELFGSVSYIKEYFGKSPTAYIWPGGGFSPQAAQIAREAGFELGFTVNPRGPLMFNWIPLADAQDEGRPAYQAEGAVGDPLMVLPRFWDQDARFHLDTIRNISKQANAYALENKAAELEYYDIVCRGITGEIPGLNP